MKMFNRVAGCSTVVVALALGVSTVQAQNLLVNGSFEQNTTTPNPITLAGVGQGWSSDFGGSPFTQSSAHAQDGSFSLLAQNAPGNNWNPQGAYQIVPATAGLTYNLSAYFLADTALTGSYGTPIGVQLTFFDAALTDPSLGNAPGAGFVALDGLNAWQQYGVTGTAPAGTAYMAAYVWFMDNGQTATDTIYIDNASLTVVPEPTTLALAGLGGAAALGLIRRRKS